MASRRRKSPQQQVRRETKRQQTPGAGGSSSPSSSSSPSAVLVPLAAKIQSVLWQVEFALRATLASIVVFLIGLYRESWTNWEEMAFGLSRWFKGEGEGDDVEMDERKKLLSDRSTLDGKKVKRRRAQQSLPACEFALRCLRWPRAEDSWCWRALPRHGQPVEHAVLYELGPTGLRLPSFPRQESRHHHLPRRCRRPSYTSHRRSRRYTRRAQHPSRQSASTHTTSRAPSGSPRTSPDPATARHKGTARCS